MVTVTVKTTEEIERMREAGKRLARVHEKLKESIRPGFPRRKLTGFAKN